MKLLKLDKKFAVEFFQGKECKVVNNYTIFESHFGPVIFTEQGDYILTDEWGVKAFTHR